MDVSIIIVSYNKFDYLKKCIESIIQHTKGLSYEIIIVDNNSSEGSVHEVVKNYNNTVLIQNDENRGFAAANNQGIKIAKGKYCLILNNDTELFENSLKNVYDFAESFTDDAVLGCQLLNGDSSNQESAVQFPTIANIFTENFFLYKLFPKNKYLNKYYLNEISISSPTPVDVVKGAFLFTKTEVLKNVNGFDEKFFFYSEETDLCYRLKKEFKIKIVLLPSVRVYHYNKDGDKLRPWFHFYNVSIGKIQFYQKHFHNITFIFAIGLHFLGNLLRFFSNISLAFIKLDLVYYRKALYFLRLLFIYPQNQFADNAKD